jgi:hypothetical protein
MKTSQNSLAWALMALIAFVMSPLLHASGKTSMIRTSGVITTAASGNIAHTMIFEVTDAPPGGSRFLIQAHGIPENDGRRLDPVMILFADGGKGGEFKPIAVNDDWRKGWSQYGVVSNANPERISAFQSIANSPVLGDLDSALAVRLDNGFYTVVVGGYGGSVGLVDVGFYRINEAPTGTSVSWLPVVEIGEVPLVRVSAQDPDDDDIEFLFDMDGDGKVDIVSPRVRSGSTYWPMFFKFDTAGQKTVRVWTRDSRGATSTPLVLTVEVRQPAKG